MHTVFGLKGPLTHRQYIAWRYWLNMQWNIPSRSDHYQMLTSCEVRRVLSQKPNAIQPKDFKLKFVATGTKSKAVGLTQAEIIEQHKQRRIAWATANVGGRYDKVTAPEAVS